MVLTSLASSGEGRLFSFPWSFHSGKVRPRAEVLITGSIGWRVDSPSGLCENCEVSVTVPWLPVDDGGENGFSALLRISLRMRDWYRDALESMLEKVRFTRLTRE
jgi:hypothetical protein